RLVDIVIAHDDLHKPLSLRSMEIGRREASFAPQTRAPTREAWEKQAAMRPASAQSGDPARAKARRRAHETGEPCRMGNARAIEGGSGKRYQQEQRDQMNEFASHPPHGAVPSADD
ncbi:MAG: hypothetical protein K2X76_15130, partial [Sphingomonas sp.]|nr:hypothetical protein [Sphingomonas sp.]